MKLGKPHLILSLTMVVASIVYNVWVFTRPARRSAPVSAPAGLLDTVGQSGPVVTGDEPVAAIDPASIPPPPAVDLTHAPEWPRNPFANAWRRRPEAATVVPAVQIESEPEVVVASILHSEERRLAVVNGRIVRAGDRVGSNTIVDIQPRGVVVESARGSRRLIELRTAPIRRNSSTAAKGDVR
jgi:hypothetical protein